MPYLDQPYPSNFEEICASYPLWYMNVYEMVQVFKAEGKLLDGVCEAIETMVLNNFIKTADEGTIEQWEAATKIRPYPGATLEERRATIIAHFCGHGHIGAPEIIEITKAFIDADVDVDFNKGVIYVRVSCGMGVDPMPQVYYDILQERIPAHLRLVVVLTRTWENVPARVMIGGMMQMHFTVTALPELTFPFDFGVDVPMTPVYTHYSETRIKED